MALLYTNSIVLFGVLAAFWHLLLYLFHGLSKITVTKESIHLPGYCKSKTALLGDKTMYCFIRRIYLKKGQSSQLFSYQQKMAAVTSAENEQFFLQDHF